MRIHGFLTNVLSHMNERELELAERLIKKHRTLYFEEGWELSVLNADGKFMIFHTCNYERYEHEGLELDASAIIADAPNLASSRVDGVGDLCCKGCKTTAPEDIATLYELLRL